MQFAGDVSGQLELTFPIFKRLAVEKLGSRLKESKKRALMNAATVNEFQEILGMRAMRCASTRGFASLPML